MNPVDITLVLILVFFLIKGFIRGIILEVFTLAGIIVAYITALRQTEWAAAMFARLTEMPPFVAASLGFLAIFTAVIISFRLIAVMLHKIVKKTPVNALNRGGGLFVGMLKGILAASLVAHLVAVIPAGHHRLAQEREHSRLIEPAKIVAPFLFNLVKNIIPETKPFADELQEGLSKAVDETGKRLIDQTKESVDRKLRDGIDKDSLEEQVRDVLEQN